MPARTHRPLHHPDRCKACGFCRLMCPDLAITADPATRLPLIDLDYCKGCGLCHYFCPRKAIAMILEDGGD